MAQTRKQTSWEATILLYSPALNPRLQKIGVASSAYIRPGLEIGKMISGTHTFLEKRIYNIRNDSYITHISLIHL